MGMGKNMKKLILSIFVAVGVFFDMGSGECSAEGLRTISTNEWTLVWGMMTPIDSDRFFVNKEFWRGRSWRYGKKGGSWTFGRKDGAFTKLIFIMKEADVGTDEQEEVIVLGLPDVTNHFGIRSHDGKPISYSITNYVTTVPWKKPERNRTLRPVGAAGVRLKDWAATKRDEGVYEIRGITVGYNSRPRKSVSMFLGDFESSDMLEYIGSSDSDGRFSFIIPNPSSNAKNGVEQIDERDKFSRRYLYWMYGSGSGSLRKREIDYEEQVLRTQ